MKRNTRKFLNLNRITKYSLAGYNRIHEIYYRVDPYNLNVLSDEVIISKVNCLVNVIKGLGKFEIICLNGKENFEENKRYYKELYANETNDAIKIILDQQSKMLEEIQANTASSRIFLIGIRLNEEKGFKIDDYLNLIEKALSSNGLSIHRIDKDELKEVLAVYFMNMVLFDAFADVEGEEWYV